MKRSIALVGSCRQLLVLPGLRALLAMATCATGWLLCASHAGEPRADFGDTARAIRKAIFEVGSERGHGTAWVISKKHRLLATNAHVADIALKSPLRGRRFS